MHGISTGRAKDNMVSLVQVTKSAALEYMLSHVDVWMQFMLSGKADVALWSARLMYTCAASGPAMQQALHDSAIMLVIEKLLESATSQTSQGTKLRSAPPFKLCL